MRFFLKKNPDSQRKVRGSKKMVYSKNTDESLDESQTNVEEPPDE